MAKFLEGFLHRAIAIDLNHWNLQLRNFFSEGIDLGLIAFSTLIQFVQFLLDAFLELRRIGVIVLSLLLFRGHFLPFFQVRQLFLTFLFFLKLTLAFPFLHFLLKFLLNGFSIKDPSQILLLVLLADHHYTLGQLFRILQELQERRIDRLLIHVIEIAIDKAFRDLGQDGGHHFHFVFLSIKIFLFFE